MVSKSLSSNNIRNLLDLRVEKNNANNDNGNQGGPGGTIAVAIDDSIPSQNALRWAVDKLVSRYTPIPPIKLLHVVNPNATGNKNNNTSNAGQTHDATSIDFLLPFRCYCTRKRVQCETVIIEDQMVVEALIEYITRHGIQRLVLGGTSKGTGFSRRLFRASHESIPSRILKLAPHFCSVYIIHRQGKLSEAREAYRPVPNFPNFPTADDQRASESEHTGAPGNKAYDEVSVPDNEILMLESDMSLVSSGRPSTDSSISFYQNFGSAAPGIMSLAPSESSNYLEGIAKLESDFGSFDLNYLHHQPSSISQGTGGGTLPLVSQKVVEEMEEEMKRLRVELKQTMDMYHAACKEAVAAKQKAIELEEWKIKEGQRLEEEQETRATMEKDKSNSKAATWADDDHEEAAQRFAEKEVQPATMINANQIFRALREADDEERMKVLDALGQSRMISKYQSLVHIIVVLLLFSFYFSIF